MPIDTRNDLSLLAMVAAAAFAFLLGISAHAAASHAQMQVVSDASVQAGPR